MNKYRKNDETNLLLITLGSFIMVFALAVMITLPGIQVNFLQSKSLERITQSEKFTNIYLFMLGAEIPQFKSSLGEELKIPSVSNLTIEIITGFKTDNISTLLLHEVPGFNAANTEIYIAGAGSDYSNLPQESPPPDFDALLKQEGSNKDEISNSLAKENDTNGNDESQHDSSVFIYHSHSWEGFLPLIDDEDVKPSDSSSTDNNKNVVLVGTMLTDKLKEYGINTVHNEVNAAKALSEKD